MHITNHTPETLAQSALDAIGAKPYVYGSASAYMDRDRLAAIEYAANATLEEIEDKTPEDLELVLESILVLAR